MRDSKNVAVTKPVTTLNISVNKLLKQPGLEFFFFF